MDDDFVRDARKGKAKLEEEDPDPKPNPYAMLPEPITKSYSNLDEDVIYMKLLVSSLQLIVNVYCSSCSCFFIILLSERSN